MIKLKKITNQDGSIDCNVAISKSEWKDILQDEKFEAYIETLLKFYNEPEHKSTCKNLGLKYNVPDTHFIGKVTAFAKAVQKELNRFKIENKDGKPTFWVIPMTGKTVENGLFEWTLRKELVGAISELELMKKLNIEEMNLVRQYDWINYFQAICNKINAISKLDNREKELLKYSLAIFGKEHNINKYLKIDPLSFIYTLAQKNTTNQFLPYFSKAKMVFEIDAEIPTDRIFPTPTPHTMGQFYSNGICLNNEGIDIGNEVLWDIFNNCFTNEVIPNLDFIKTLSIKNVAIVKLTQVLFLINPNKFMPLDTQMNGLPAPSLTKLNNVVDLINTEGIEHYFSLIKTLKASYPNCELYEINLLNVLLSDGDLKINNKYLVVSSLADGKNNTDYFKDFVKQNAVWVGGPTTTTGQKKYSLTDFKKGDIVLVRRGTKRLGGIAIIKENEYLKTNGYNEDAKLRIIWLNKLNQKLDYGLGQWIGFDKATENTIKSFNSVYKNTFEIIDFLKKIHNMNPTVIKPFRNNFKKQFILQGPPGTGKTRLAKKLANIIVNQSFDILDAIENQQNIEHIEDSLNNNETAKIIQFHPSYTYEDFVRGIVAKPNKNGKGIIYKAENKVLAKFADKALKNPTDNYVLIIDEINRANLSSVLGELIYALEYRGEEVESMYKFKGSNKLILPKNLYIIGTMNTADRSVGHIDYAVRRRFAFVDVLPEKLEDSDEIYFNTTDFETVSKLFNETNVSSEFDIKDVQIGHSYFIALKEDITEEQTKENIFNMKMKYEVVPILLEYVKDGILINQYDNLPIKEYIEGLKKAL